MAAVTVTGASCAPVSSHYESLAMDSSRRHELGAAAGGVYTIPPSSVRGESGFKPTEDARDPREANGVSGGMAEVALDDEPAALDLQIQPQLLQFLASGEDPLANGRVPGAGASASAVTVAAGGDDFYHAGDDTTVLVPMEKHRSGRNRVRDRLGEHQLTANPAAHEPPHHCHQRIDRSMDTLARNQLIVVSLLCTAFMIAEIIGGLLSNSLALVTDATHLASDLAGFLASLLAIWLATKPPSQRLTFGYYRAEVLGAFVSILIIWIVTGVLVYLAVHRVIHSEYHIDSTTMLITAGVGVAFNLIMGFVLHSGFVKLCKLPDSKFGHGHSHGGDGHGHSHGEALGHGHGADDTYHREDVTEEDSTNLQTDPELSGADDVQAHAPTRTRNINIRAAMIHVIGDLIQSIGVFLAAIVIKVKPEYKIADPICTFVFSILVLITTSTVLRDIVLVFMEASPRNVSHQAVRLDLQDLEGVRSAHSLHMWALTLGKPAITVHLAVDDSANSYSVQRAASKLLSDKYDAAHCTIQVESYDSAFSSSCDQCQGPP